MRRTFALSIAAGLLALWPASNAHAQAAYGYDSYYYSPTPSATYWYNSGYGGMYTAPTNGTFAAGTVAPFNGVAGYTQPPYSQFGRSDGLATASPGTVTRAPAAPVAAPTTARRAVPTTTRRGIIARMRGRR
ncbi:MAG: hypothetical protein U0835_21125 [Isosphaeraceae bacterium]